MHTHTHAQMSLKGEFRTPWGLTRTEQIFLSASSVPASWDQGQVLELDSRSSERE